jgi:hypothetical protein
MAMGPSILDVKMQFHKAGSIPVSLEPSDEDTAGDVKYYGFLSGSGSWLIMEMDTTTPTAITYRYYAGQSAYAANWDVRGDLEYVLFNEIGDSL